ncbi:MAG: CocE/NonD family hydrolase C-terminal non-catalytic domain-containing protein [Polyangiales bacterium]
MCVHRLDDAQCHCGGVRSFRRADAAPLGEGEVAALTFELLPISHLWRRGHRVRLALAAGDADHFARPPEDRAVMRVHRTPSRASRLVLPVARP